MCNGKEHPASLLHHYTLYVYLCQGIYRQTEFFYLQRFLFMPLDIYISSVYDSGMDNDKPLTIDEVFDSEKFVKEVLERYWKAMEKI